MPEKKNPDYSATAVNLTNPPEILEKLDRLKVLKHNVADMEKSLEENPVYINIKSSEKEIQNLTDQIKDMIDAGIISHAMLPKVEACITALDGGANKAHIIDGRIEHSLLLEIYTDKGVGTQIIKNLEGKGT